VRLTTDAEHFSKTLDGALAMLALMSGRTAAVETPARMTGGSPMTTQMPGGPEAGDRFVRLDDGDVHVVQDGRPGAPALLLIQNGAAPIALWDPVVPSLAGAYRIVRVDLLGYGQRSRPAAAYDVPAQARRAGAALERLGVNRVTVIGHSSGGMVATALAEQRPGTVAALVLINTGPSPDAKIPDPPLARLLTAPVAGRLLWRLKSEATIRNAARSGFTRAVDVPDALVEHVQRMSYRSFTATMRGYWDYLRQRSLPERLAPLGLPVLVIFGTDDQRWRSSSADAYRIVPGARVEMLPGLGHTPIIEDPNATAKLLLDFASAAQSS
jgi:pimeloyl-ACP methyl ester carboxylesterase